MRRAPVAFALIACLAGAGVACTESDKLPDHLMRSDHVRYFSRGNDSEVCPALLGELEDHGRVISDALGIEQPLVTYYKFHYSSDYKANAGCPEGAAACALNATTRTPSAFDRHELIHAYLSPHGRPPALLTEGAAVALSCTHYPRPTGTWKEALAAESLSRALYGGGGWLVAHLLRTYPQSWFLDLYGSLQINATADEVEKVFVRIYDVPLDDVWAAAIGGPLEARYCPWECTRPAVQANGATQSLPSVCVPGTAQLTVDIPPDDGITRWLLDGNALLSVASCDGNEQPLGVISGFNGTGALLAPLVPGKYFIDVVFDNISTGGAALLSINTHALPALSSADCATAAPVVDDLSGYNNLTLFYPSSSAPQFTTFSVGRDDDAILNWSSDDPAATATSCATCDTTNCAPFGVGGGLGTSTPTGSVLGVPPGPSMTANIMWFPPPPDGGV